MKCKRLLAGMMSLAMLCSVASTPIYALDEAGSSSVPAVSQETDSTPAENPDPTPAPEETPAPTGTPAPEATPAPTGTPAPEETPAPTGTPAPEATPAPTATPAPAANTLQENREVTANANLQAEAERYYGEEGIITVGKVSATWNSQSQAETVLAGETLTLDIDWFLEAASSYTYASHQESMFEEYRNTVITLQLPEHVTILDPDVTAGELNNVQSIEDLGNNTWAIHLSESINAISASNGTLSLPLFVEGNGQLPIGTLLDFSQEKISLTTQFTILDRTSGQAEETNLHYEKTYESALPADKKLGSNDQWGIQKQGDGNPVIDEGADTVTLQFTLTVGLIEKDLITDNPQTYSREGRVPFQDNQAELTEIPTVKGYDGQDILPQTVTVTPAFGENPQPIQVTGNQRITLPVDTVGNHTDIVTGQVDAGAPYWSQYHVTLVYDYQDFVADYNENSDPLDVLNTATLYYTLDTVGDGTEQTAQDDATQPVQVVAQPATLKVEKYILEGDAATPYDSTYADSAIQGAAGFTIRRTDGESFTLYTLAGGRYQAQTGTTVTVNPKGSGALNGTDGSVTVYLDPGSYEITESQNPANTQPVAGGEHNADPKTVTIQAGASATAAFYNRALLGSVTVTKTDEKDQRMAGATFRLYNENKSYDQSLTTGTDGVITFHDLPYGSYTLEETNAPEGYLASTVLHVDITEDHPNATYTVPNYPSQISVTLQKQKTTSEGAKDLDSTESAMFKNAFALEKWNSTSEEWEVVQENLSLGTLGHIVREVEVYENDDPTKPITYRFKETLPTGWHDPDDATATVQYSEKFTMLDEKGHPADKTIYMENRANGTLRLTKEFYTVQRGRYTKMTSSLPNATFALYQKQGDTVTRVGENYTTQNGQLTIQDLAPADEEGNLYEYYLVESPLQGYQGDTTETTDLATPDQGTQKAYGPYTFAGDTRLVTPTVKNYRTGVIVYKVNSVTGAFVNGTKVTVYAYDETQPDHKGAALEGKTDLAVANGGTFIPLNAGSKYVVEETVWNTKYQPDVKSGEVDLTAVMVGQDDQIPTVTLKNTPMPCLRITKTSQNATGTITTVNSKVEFEVYTGSETDHLYTPVKNSDGSTLTIRNNRDVYLPAGTYYLKEVPQDGLVDPSAHPEVYTGENWIKETGATYYKVELPAVTAENDGQNVSVTIPNYNVNGAVTMTKYAAQTTGGTVPLKGAQIALYRVEEDENGQPKEVLVNTKTTTAAGTVKFGNLSIYDANGQKITYRLREITPPNNYSLNPQTLEFTLTPGQTVTTDGNNQPLQLVDQPLVTFQVTKVYRKLWEYNFTRKDYVLQGARIALFRQEADGSYSYDKMATTDELGQVSFDNLEQDVTYVAVEYDVPGNVEGFAYLTPWNPRTTDDPNKPGDQRDRLYLSATYTLEQLQAEDFRLSADDLTKYNYVTKPARTGDAAPVSRVEDILYNAEHWTQLHIEKFVTETQGENIGQERPINNAQFALYRQVVGDGATELSFDQSQTTFVGRYSSGTLYDADGKRMDGWFGTDILQAGKNIVYWLVEETPGTGAAISDQNRVILIARRGTAYTNNTQYTYTYQDENGQAQQATAHCTQRMDYVTDKVTEEKVKNSPIYGDGGAMYATLRIAKWAGSYDQDGNKLYDSYEPLGNATFDVYVVHADGSPVEKIDTLTTGLDNDNEDLANPDDLTAWASSRSYDFQAMWDKYASENTNEKDVIWRDGGNGDTGNGYLRLMLVETSTPTGYNATTQLFKMILFFEDNANNTVTETFNDAYYIKNDTPANDQEKTTDDQGDAWACYPVDGQDNALTVDDPTVTAGQYRLVNWPVDNFAVTVTKYGYPYSEAVQGKSNSELTAYFQSDMSNFAQLTPLEGVTLRLERFTNNSWQTYAYPLTNGKNQTDGLLETDAKGYFAFPAGLIVGRYRLIEVDGPSGYDLIYDGSEDQNGNKKVFYFEVSNENVNLMLYNPESVEISVQKQDLGGTALRGATFTLSQNGQSVSQGNTLTTNRSGVYTLAETTAPSGYSNTYFADYLQETYQGYTWGNYNLGNFASDGIYLGYQTEAVVDEETGEPLDVKVTQKVDLSSYQNDQGAALDPLTVAIRDPRQASLTLTKKDGNTKEPMSGVTFQVWYQPFTNWSDTTQAVGTNWTELLTDNAAARTTGATGTVTLNGLNPGIYKVQESSGPATYTLDKTPQYIVLTGGMNKTVTQDETNLDSGNTSGSLAFTNYKKVDLTVNKTVATGSLTMPADESHTFTFTLTKADGSKVEKKMEWPKETSVTFENLDQGAQYTLTETCDEHFVFQSFTGVTMDEHNTFTMPYGDNGLTVTATNTWLQASLTVQKVDGATGTPLDGAALDVYRIDADEDGQETATKVGTMTGDGQGNYTLSVALTKTTGETFEIRETQAPAGYVLKNQTLRIENVLPGQAVQPGTYDESMANNDEALQNAKLVPNYTGAIIELTKYDNRHGSLTAAPLQGATFLLYRRVDGENGEAATWQQAGRATTNAQGKISFTVEGNAVYALKEEGQPAGYAGLEGIWAGDTEITPDAEGYYLLNGGQALQSTFIYQVEAYDIPYVTVELRKENALDKSKEAPTATAAIYEVDTPTMTADQVKALLADEEKEPLTTVNIQSLRTGQQNNYKYATVENLFAVGKTYLVVETNSSISQIQDHNAVVWYQVYTVPDNDEEKIVTLSNVEGKASQSLTKTTTQESYPSLMASAAELEYTLTPQVGDNTYPLDSYTLTDNGLVTAKGKDPDTHVETALVWEDYLKDAYTITGVTLEPSSHDAAAYLNGTEPDDLQATVRYYDFSGNEITALTETLDATVRQVRTPVTTTPIAKVTVSYESPTLKQQTGYALGQYFVPGTVTVKLRLNQQQGGPSVWPISQVENQAEATLVYTPRNGDGTPGTQVTDTKQDTAANTFGELEAARVSVEKNADQRQVTLGDTVTYTITIHNAENAGAPYYQPFLVDLLPQGTALAGDGGNVRLTKAPDGVTLRSLSTASRDGENALFIYLDGDLEPGESATIQLDVKIEATAALYGSSINNYVLAGSQVKGIQSASNPQSSSFQSDNGQWPKSLDGVVTTMEESRRNTLSAMLEEKANFGFVSAKDSITWATNSNASVIKTGRGNLSANLGFTSDHLATVSNDGTMEYRLQFSNLSDDSKGEGGTYMTGAILLDVFPFVGDETAAHADRGTQWSMKFDPDDSVAVTIESIQSDENMDETVVETTLTAGTDYKVYYFNQPIDETNLQTVYGQIESLTYDATTLPQGWSDTAGADTRAFAVAINDTQESIALAPNQSYVVHYQLNVGDLDEETLAEYAWNNAVNHFLCSYSSYTKSAGIATARRAPTALNSNLVSNTILPTQVKVGGHVWVDKNADGIRQAGELATEMPDNALVQQLLEDVQVTLETYKGDGTIPTVTTFAKTGEDWDNNANFIFDKLDPASPKENASQSELYGSNVLNNPLNPFYLKGQAPKTYRITASLPEDSVLATLTGLGGGNPDKEEQGYSRDPELLASQYADETVDNNFLAQAGDTTAHSERFFLYSKPEEIFDNTKDVGYVLQRTLTLTKTNKDGTENLPGATFQVYGPFNSVEEANAATLSQANLVEEVTTDATGSATLTTPLNWFQVYLIVEKDSPFGYQLEGATAANGDGVVRDYTGTATQNPAWILDVPGNTVTNQNQQVTVADRTEVEYNLTATKTLEGKPLQDNQFTFELLDVNMQPLATARNIGGVATFPTISADRSGETTYYIREVIPQDAQQLVYNNTLYDDTMYKVVVQVITNPDNGRLEETIRTYEKNADGTWTETSQGARFTNRYLPAFETAYSPMALKQFSSDSDPHSADDTFTFVLAAAQDYGAAVQMNPGSDGRCTAAVVDEGVARFQPITFTQEGVYRFTLEEDNDGLDGYTYDETRWILEVEVTRQENDLAVTRADYTTEDGEKARLATFTNSYHSTGTPPENPPESPSDEEEGTTPTTPLQTLQQWIGGLLPQTGDQSQPLVWVILLCVSAVCLAGIYFYRKRKR